MDERLRQDILKAIEDLDNNPEPPRPLKKKRKRSKRLAKTKTIPETSPIDTNQPTITFNELPVGTKLDFSQGQILKTKDGKIIVIPPKSHKLKQD